MMVLNWIGRNPLKLVLSIVLVWMFWGPVFHFFIAPWANDLVYPDPKQTALDLAGVSIISVGNMVAGADPATDGLILTRYGERTKECDAKYDGECPNIVLTTEKLPIEIDPLAGHNLLILKDGRIVYTDINDARDSISFRIFNPDTGTTSTILTKPYIEFFDYDQKLASSTPVPPLDTMDQYIGFIGNTPLIEDTDEEGNTMVKFMDVVPNSILISDRFGLKNVKGAEGLDYRKRTFSLSDESLSLSLTTRSNGGGGSNPASPYFAYFIVGFKQLRAQIFKSIYLHHTRSQIDTFCVLDNPGINLGWTGGGGMFTCHGWMHDSLKLYTTDRKKGKEVYSFGEMTIGNFRHKNDTECGSQDHVVVQDDMHEDGSSDYKSNNWCVIPTQRTFEFKNIVSPDVDIAHFIIPTLGDYLLATDGSRDTALVSVPGHIVSVRRVDTSK